MKQKRVTYLAIAIAIFALIVGGYALYEAGNAVESMTLHPNISATVTGAFTTNSTTTSGSDGAGADVTWHSGTSGDLLLWDASDVALEITGTDSQDAINVADGDVSIVDALDVDGATSLDALTTGVAGTGHDVQFFSDTSGDHLLWDASEEALEITGTNAQVALLVDDGNVSVTDDVDVDGATSLDALTTGVAGTGHDVQFFSDTSGDHLLWDASEEALEITGTDSQVALLVDDGDVSITDDFTVGSGIVSIPIGVAHIGTPAIASVNITYTAAAGGTGTVLTIAGGTAVIVHDVWVETTTNFDCTGDDVTLNIGDSDDEDGFCVLADANVQDAYAAFTGAAAGWSCNAVATRGIYLDEAATNSFVGSMVYDGVDAITWTLDEGAGESITAGAATVWVSYTRIK